MSLPTLGVYGGRGLARSSKITTKSERGNADKRESAYREMYCLNDTDLIGGFILISVFDYILMIALLLSFSCVDHCIFDGHVGCHIEEALKFAPTESDISYHLVLPSHFMVLN